MADGETRTGAAPEADKDHATSALPCTWGRQDGPIPNLEEWEKTARLVGDAKPRAAAHGPAPRARRKKRPASRHFDPDHVGIYCRSSRGLPSGAAAYHNIPKRTSSMRGSVDSASDDGGDVADRDVLRGLHVAAAACDEEVDAFMRGRTGLRIRRFLADLMALEALGAGGPR